MAKTIEEIAKLAGVSKTTVSLVINEKASSYRISAKTQSKIRKIVELEGFVPNVYARGFRMKKTRTIGLVVPDLTNWFFSQICREIELLARNESYQVFIGSSDDKESTEFEVIQNFVDRKVDGLIVASVMKKDKITKDILKIKIPVIYIDRRIETDRVSWVASDNFKGAFDLVNLLCSRGVSTPYYLGGTPEISTSINRIQGYREALAVNGLEFDSGFVFQDNYTIQAGYRLMAKIFQRDGTLPKAFVAGSFTLLEGALRFIKDQEGGFPRGIQIATYDDHPLLDFLSMSGHKIYAPKGIGILFARRGVRLRKFITGGHHEFNKRGGTLNVPFIIAMAKAFELLDDDLKTKKQDKLAQLRDRIERELMAAVPYMHINGEGADRLSNTTNMSFDCIEGESILFQLDKMGFCVSSGSACTSGSLEPSHVLRAMHVPISSAHSSIRVSLGRYTNKEEVDAFINAIPHIVERLREISPFWDKKNNKPNELAEKYSAAAECATAN